MTPAATFSDNALPKTRNLLLSCAAGANLKNTNMSFANLEGCNLTDSICMQVGLGCTNACCTFFLCESDHTHLYLHVNWLHISPHLVQASFANSNLKHAIITNANLDGANLDGADLRSHKPRCTIDWHADGKSWCWWKVSEVQ